MQFGASWRTMKLNAPRIRGFTLIELLIVVTVLALLATIAVNSYRNYVLRSGRTEAMAALTELAQLQEQYYANQQAYTGSLSTLNYDATTPNGLYDLSVSTSATVNYTITATADNAQLKDRPCRTFTLNGMGERDATHADGSTDTTDTCWER